MKGQFKMLIIKATKDTMKDLKVKPDLDGNSDLFYSWHVNIFTLYRKKHFVFMNDLARLSLTVTGIRSGQHNKLKEIFVDALKEYLIEEEIPEYFINSYFVHCKEMIITKTDSRSVLSTLSEIMFVMKSLEMDNQGFENKDERHKWNNRFIYKPIDYQKPIEVFIKNLNKDIQARFRIFEEGTGIR